MAYLDLERLLDKSGGSVYKLVVLASKEALEIAESQYKHPSANPGMKPSAVALKNIAEGRVRYKKATVK